MCIAIFTIIISNYLGINLLKNAKEILISIYLFIPKIILQLFGYPGDVLKFGNIIQLVGPVTIGIDSKIIGLRYFFIALAIFILTVQSKWAAIKYCIITILTIPILSSLLIIFRSFNIIDSPDTYSLLFESTIVLCLLVFLYWHNKTLKPKTSTERGLCLIDKDIRLSLYFAVILFVMFVRIVLKYSIANDILANIILYTSKWMLHLFNYQPFIFGRNIKGDNAWIEIRNMCLGTNVMLVYAGFIFIFFGRLQRKFQFIIMGIVLIIIVNIIRIAFLYVYLDKNGGIYAGFVNVHDLFNYPVYALVLFLWYIYLKNNRSLV